MTQEQRATKVVEDHAQATKRDWSATDHRLYAVVLDALRAAPPAPAPELVALVQELRAAQRAYMAVRGGAEADDAGQRVARAAAAVDVALGSCCGRPWDCPIDDKLCPTTPTPAAPVEPPARPETGTRELLAELVTLVRGECPSLLNEDSGGDGRLSGAIDRALAARPETEPNDGPPKREGDERLMLNAYGRQCHAAGFAAGYERKKAEIAETAAATPAPTRELLGRVDFFLDQCDSSKGHEAAEFWLGRAYGIIRDVRAALSSPVGETPAPDEEFSAHGWGEAW